jgi:DNA-binding MarR family transcriptional regulator
MPTSKTLAVLRAISEHPGCSNTDIGLIVGGGRAQQVDAGQLSKLLTRLRERALVSCGPRKGRGAPNAWHLTEAGESLLETGAMLAVTPAAARGYVVTRKTVTIEAVHVKAHTRAEALAKFDVGISVEKDSTNRTTARSM